MSLSPFSFLICLHVHFAVSMICFHTRLMRRILRILPTDSFPNHTCNLPHTQARTPQPSIIRHPPNSLSSLLLVKAHWHWRPVSVSRKNWRAGLSLVRLIAKGIDCLLVDAVDVLGDRVTQALLETSRLQVLELSSHTQRGLSQISPLQRLWTGTEPRRAASVSYSVHSTNSIHPTENNGLGLASSIRLDLVDKPLLLTLRLGILPESRLPDIRSGTDDYTLECCSWTVLALRCHATSCTAE